MDQIFFQNTFDNLLCEKDAVNFQQGFDELSTGPPLYMENEEKDNFQQRFLQTEFNNEYDSEDFIDPVRREISCAASQSGQSRYSGYSTLSSDDNSKHNKMLEKKKRAIKREIAKSRKISKVESENIDSLDIDPKEKKKVQQMLKNRISAQASRDRKKVYINSLESKNYKLETLNSQYQEKLRRFEEENRILKNRLAECSCSTNNMLSPSFLKFGLSIFTLVSVFLVVGIKNQENSKIFKSEGTIPSMETSSLLKLPLPELKALGYSPNFELMSDSMKEARQYVESNLPMEIIPQTNAIVPVKGPRKAVRAGKRKEKPESVENLSSQLTTILCPTSYYMQDDQTMKKLKIEELNEEEFIYL